MEEGVLPNKPNQDTMSCDKSRTITGQVDVGSDNSSTVAAHDLHGDSGSPLEVAANVSTVPSQAKRDLWVDTWHEAVRDIISTR
jgi:hypothetical protein